MEGGEVQTRRHSTAQDTGDARVRRACVCHVSIVCERRVFRPRRKQRKHRIPPPPRPSRVDSVGGGDLIPGKGPSGMPPSGRACRRGMCWRRMSGSLPSCGSCRSRFLKVLLPPQRQGGPGLAQVWPLKKTLVLRVRTVFFKESAHCKDQDAVSFSVCGTTDHAVARCLGRPARTR